ncbi:MAG: uridine phosphorylase [Bacillaceae bacterium]|nr:uridine phosphorylase [Bacillaceae bacterium]
MKLYGEFTKQDWLTAFDIEEDKVPESFILHGAWEHEHNLSLWKEMMSEDIWQPHWNSMIGNLHHRKIGFANIFGGPAAAVISHQFATLGTDVFIQTGYFGCLSRHVQFGDILIVTAAEMGDGVSHWYLKEEKIVKSDRELVEAAINFCEEKGYRYTTGTVFTTSAIMMETRDVVQKWAEKGHIGVDMETATTLAVARRFNKKAVGILNLSDHIITGDTFYSSNGKRDEIKKKTDDRIRELALYLAGL